MIIFFHTFNTNNPAALLLPLAMFVLFAAISMVPRTTYYSYVGPMTGGVYSYDSGSGEWTRDAEAAEGFSMDSLWPFLTGFGLTLLAFYGFARQVREQGFSGTLGSIRESVSGLWGAGSPAPTRRPSRRISRNRTMRPRDMLADTIRSLPVEPYLTKRELEEMTISELKAKAAELHVDTQGAVEKRDLITAMLGSGGSSGTSCSICCEDYESGEPLRILPCKHRFHVECVDKWFFSGTSSKKPCCPMCNTALVNEE